MPPDATSPQSSTATETEDLAVRYEDVHWIIPKATGEQNQIGLLAELPAKSFALNYQVIAPLGSSDLHRHYHEAAHVVIDGSGHSEIDGTIVPWREGDVIYIPPWKWHRHYNTSADVTVRMLVVENSKLLESLGPVNRRESAGLVTFADVKDR